MIPIPIANILHNKLRSILTALGVAMAVCMVITLTGLSRGSLYELADRWESVDADLVLAPPSWMGAPAARFGGGLRDRYADDVLAAHDDIVDLIVPIYFWRVSMAGQEHLAAGVDPQNWDILLGGLAVDGRVFDPNNRFSEWLEATLTNTADSGQVIDPTQEFLGDPAHNGLEIVIDSKLANAGGYQIGQTVSVVGYEWTIVGIVPEGGMARIYMPRRTAQFLDNAGSIRNSTLMFVQLADGVDPTEASMAIERTVHVDAIDIDDYRAALVGQFEVMFVYVDVVNLVALTIAFLFIMVMLYATVLQRTREIAILKAEGAGSAYLVMLIAVEGLLITAAGVAVGVGLSYLLGWVITKTRPLLTIDISWAWISRAVALAFVGAIVSAIYPAWRATRVDMVEALSLE
jgi:putative ABC transport system permease protein